MSDRLLLTEAAERMRMGRSFVHELIRRELLPSVRRGGCRRVLVAGTMERLKSEVPIDLRVAASGVTGSYIKEAEQQRSTADVWRLGSVAFLLLTAAGALLTGIWSPLNGDVSPGEIATYGLTRVPVVLVLRTITTYMAAQSAHHRNRERSARRRAMELAAFRPFIGELSAAEQHTLIGETARKYFRGDRDDAISEGDAKPS